jgi:hypothetical protein
MKYFAWLVIAVLSVALACAAVGFIDDIIQSERTQPSLEVTVEPVPNSRTRAQVEADNAFKGDLLMTSGKQLEEESETGRYMRADMTEALEAYLEALVLQAQGSALAVERVTEKLYQLGLEDGDRVYDVVIVRLLVGARDKGADRTAIDPALTKYYNDHTHLLAKGGFTAHRWREDDMRWEGSPFCPTGLGVDAESVELAYLVSDRLMPGTAEAKEWALHFADGSVTEHGCDGNSYVPFGDGPLGAYRLYTRFEPESARKLAKDQAVHLIDVYQHGGEWRYPSDMEEYTDNVAEPLDDEVFHTAAEWLSRLEEADRIRLLKEENVSPKLAAKLLSEAAEMVGDVKAEKRRKKNPPTAEFS